VRPEFGIPHPVLQVGRVEAVADPEWQPVAQVLRSAAAPPRPAELDGEAAAVAAFRAAAGGRAPRPRANARYRTVLSTLLTRRIAVGVTAGAASLVGAATAAYACVLPAPIQNFAHDTFGAPAPGSHDGGRNDAGGPGNGGASASAISLAVSGSASASVSVTASGSSTSSASASASNRHVLAESYALCAAYAVATKNGSTLPGDALSDLTKLAGGSASISAYCAALPPLPKPSCPTASPSATPSATPDLRKDDDDWRLFCGVCPPGLAAKNTPTPSAGNSLTPTVDGKRWPWAVVCGGWRPGDNDPHGWPTAKPSGWPTTWPSGLPTAWPSGWPSGWPTSWPTGGDGHHGVDPRPSGKPSDAPHAFGTPAPNGGHR
jgi:hypothetical protein